VHKVSVKPSLKIAFTPIVVIRGSGLTIIQLELELEELELESLHAAPWNTEAQFSGNITQKHRREHCKTLRWRCWLGGSQPPRWR